MSEHKIIFLKVEHDYIVLEKPAGLLVHATATGKNEETLVAQLVRAYPEMVAVGDDPARPGIVHRLDRDVSGVMVVARTQAMFTGLKRQFQERKVKKEYVAVCHGYFDQKDGVIDFPMERSKLRGRKMAVRPKSQGGKEAITEYAVVREGRKRSLVAVIPKTGRTNQIRAHLAAIGHAIVGDAVYKPKKQKVKDMGRIMLHAKTIGFHDLDGAWREFHVPESDLFITLV